MRVLYLTDSLSDLDGVGRYTIGLVSALEELDPDLRAEVLLARKHRPTSAEAAGRWPTRVALPPDYFFYMSPPRFWASLFPAVWRTWRAARGADLVHAIKDYPHNLIALLGARLAGVPCIATAHGTYTVQPLLSRRHRRLAAWTYRRMAAMISVSGYTRRRLLEVLAEMGAQGPQRSRLAVIPNAVDAARFEKPPEVGPRPWQTVPYVLSIAEVKERKGLHLAVAAWARAARQRPDLHHFIVGRASGDAYQDRLVALAREAGVAERQHFLGNVGEAEKVDLLRRARVFLHTPVRAADGGFEGFGIVYLEAAAAGTPAIGTLDCGAEDAILDGRTGFLVEPRAERVQAALERLLDDSRLWQRLAQAGRRWATRSSWSENARRVRALYAEILS